MAIGQLAVIKSFLSDTPNLNRSPLMKVSPHNVGVQTLA